MSLLLHSTRKCLAHNATCNRKFSWLSIADAFKQSVERTHPPPVSDSVPASALAIHDSIEDVKPTVTPVDCIYVDEKRSGMSTFAQLGVHGSLLARMSVHYPEVLSPTPVQEQGIPNILKGENVLLGSRTGSGKTLAILLPLLTNMLSTLRDEARANKRVHGIRCVILVPSRELGLQIRDQITELLGNNYAYFGYDLDYYCSSMQEPMNLFARQLVIGGKYQQHNERLLIKNPPSILISTPRQFLSAFKRNPDLLKQVKWLVVDEADHVVKPLHKYASKWDKIRAERHGNRADHCLTLLHENSPGFQLIGASATMNAQIRMWFRTKEYTPNVNYVLADAPLALPANIQHSFVTMRGVSKFDDSLEYRMQALVKLLKNQPRDEVAMVFIDAGASVAKCVDYLNQHGRGVRGIALHDYFLKLHRKDLLKSTSNQEYNVIVATPDTVRGLDLPSVNYAYILAHSVLLNHHEYLHLSGRTARRLHSEGHCISILNEDQRNVFKRRNEDRLQLVNLQDMGQV